MYAGLVGFEDVLGVVGGGCDEDVGADVVVGLGADDDDDVSPLIRSKDCDLSVRLLESRSERRDSLVVPRPSFL